MHRKAIVKHIATQPRDGLYTVTLRVDWATQRKLLNWERENRVFVSDGEDAQMPVAAMSEVALRAELATATDDEYTRVLNKHSVMEATLGDLRRAVLQLRFDRRKERS